MKNTYQELLYHLENHEKVIIGILIEKKGSAPQVAGASALFSSKGLIYGTLGGGILEKKAEQLAVTFWDKGDSLVKTIDFTSDIGKDKGAICGGKATFLLDYNPQNSLSCFRAMDLDLKFGKCGYLITKLTSLNNTTTIERTWKTDLNEIAEIQSTGNYFEKNKSNTQLISKKEELLFIQHLTPAPHLVIIGAGHIGQALCHQGALLGFRVTVIDNRQNYANKTLLPEAHEIIVERRISSGISKAMVNKKSYVVIVTQGHKTDCEALESVINLNPEYIGMIGSKRKIQQVKQDFINRNLISETDFNKIHAPIGINIGSKTVQEIAISIAAELILKRNK